MASFTKLSASYFAIIRKDVKSQQVIIFPTSQLQDFADTLQSSLEEGLDRLSEPCLGDADFKIGDKIHVKVSTAAETGSIRTDIREWYVDTISSSIKPTKKGVNLSLEQLTTVTAEIQSFIKLERDSLMRLALASPIVDSVEPEKAEEPIIQPLPATKNPKRKAPKGKVTQPTKKKAAPSKSKKGKAAASKSVAESEEEEEHLTELLSASDEEDSE